MIPSTGLDGVHSPATSRHPFAQMADERNRLFLWSPVPVGTGAIAYFALQSEPSPWIAAGAVASLSVVGVLGFLHDRRTGGNALSLLFSALLLFALGFAAAQLRTCLVRAPAVDQRLGPTNISGTVIDVEAFSAGARLTLDALSIRGLTATQTPDRVRLRVRGDTALPRPGEKVSLYAVIEPLGAPSIPGGFDFQRYGYFQRLGAVGFVVGAIHVTASPNSGLWSLSTWFQSLRNTISNRVRKYQDNAAGSIIIALLVGETTGIPAPIIGAVRDAGLAHLLSISGVHIGMVAGMIFFWIRLLVAAIPWVALRIDPKKLAAIFAILSATFYALLSGNSVPTQRSLLMLSVVMIGVLVSRRAISMRLLAWAALVILMTQPESILGASFQMSFAAMVGLIATSEIAPPIASGNSTQRPRALKRTIFYVLAIIGSSIAATVATAPFAIFHFNRLALLGIFTNILAIPLTGFWILPWGMVALLLMPFGGENLALIPMAWGTELLIRLAQTASALPGAAILLPTLPGYGLGLVALGGLWLCLWRTGWRFAGLVAIAAGIGSMAVTPAADILIDGRGKLIGVRLTDGSLALSSATAARFARRSWLQQNADDAPATIWPQTGSLDNGRLRCDPSGCVATIDSHIVAFPRTANARTDDCREASLIVTNNPLPPPCRSTTRVLDRWNLWQNGAYAIWIEASGIRFQSVNGTRGQRPWVQANNPDLSTDDPGAD